jgi:hypothetical protein
MLGANLTQERFDSLVARAAQAPRWLELDAAATGEHYNRRGYVVTHRLPQHPMFELEALKALCRRMGPAAVKHRVGVVPVDAHFDTSLGKYRQGLAFEDAVDRLEENRAYLAVYNPEKDPEYAPVIEGLVGELGLGLRERERSFNWYSTYIFISAQDAVTPYHMDREMNYLLQIRGTKSVQLWDPMDPTVMTPAQRDYLFSHAFDARPTWRAELAPLAEHFDLAPGLGVHHPFIAPHLVTTGPALSISLAVTFRSPRSDTWSNAHFFNHKMQRFGFGRIPVHDSEVVDSVKATFVRAIRAAKSAVGRGEPRRNAQAMS